MCHARANEPQLNKQMDKNDDHHLLRLKDTFIHRQHLCLVFELLSVNLYELIKQNQFRGLSTTLVRVFAQQLINGLALLGKAKLIHCDLKPENILLKKYVIYTCHSRGIFLTLQQSRKPHHQDHRFRFRMRRTTDRVHVHSIAILPISRSLARPTIFRCYRHVVTGLHRGRAVPWSAFIPRIVRVQSSIENNRNAGPATTLDVGDGQTIWRILREDSR